MLSDPGSSPQLEMAHVLFMDIVGYSAVPEIEEQRLLLEELQEVVLLTPEFARAAASDEIIRLPTGDGLAVVFFRDPVAPVRCAMQISQSLRGRPHLKLRIGLHTGPVYRIQDINTHANVSGGGINLAQRVMDCGDAGHILLSREMAGLLSQVGSWPIHDLGECEVKHGARLHLFSLHTAELGNPKLPERLQSVSLPQSRPNSSPGRTLSPGVRVALLYKRHVEPDNHLLELLEQRLAEHGFPVFVDRHLQVGVQWAREIERQVRMADAVIPLLSAESMRSEMLEWEIQEAHKAAQEQGGKPRLMPIRVAYTGPLSEPLDAVLDPIEYALWEGPEDDERLVTEIVRALGSPPSPPAVPRHKLEAVGGAVPLDSQFYVVRPADSEFRAAIARQDSIVLIKGARQMGKTSLLARGLQQARAAGARVVCSDFQKLNAQHLQSADTLFMKLAESIADQLNLDVYPDQFWHPRRGPSENFERYWQRQALRKISEPIVWGLDEVDRLFTCDFGSEVFGLFRSWHNERALDPEGPWKRLTLAIAYATEAHLFITDVNQSPFNVGTRLALEDFTLEQLTDLNHRYGSPLHGEAEVARFARLVGGHPYLVRRGLHEMATQEMEIAAFEAQASRDEGIFGDHLRRILVLLAKDPALCEMVRSVLRREGCSCTESFFRLRSAGVMAGESVREVRPRCRLYELYLGRHLL